MSDSASSSIPKKGGAIYEHNSKSIANYIRNAIVCLTLKKTAINTNGSPRHLHIVSVFQM